jgi:hypothetical protein
MQNEFTSFKDWSMLVLLMKTTDVKWWQLNVETKPANVCISQQSKKNLDSN